MFDIGQGGWMTASTTGGQDSGHLDHDIGQFGAEEPLINEWSSGRTRQGPIPVYHPLQSSSTRPLTPWNFRRRVKGKQAAAGQSVKMPTTTRDKEDNTMWQDSAASWVSMEYNGQGINK